MEGCTIDYCEGKGETTLTIHTEQQTITLALCRDHADALEMRLAEVLSLPRHLVNLRTQTLPGTVGDVCDAIDYLDEMEERKCIFSEEPRA